MAQRPNPETGTNPAFRDFQDEVSRQTADESGDRHLRLGVTYWEMGLTDAALKELEQAARLPRLRFEAASRMARLLRDRGALVPAIEWFERAAETPAPTVEDGRALLYELARALEEGGEAGRALAIYTELQADLDGDYRDVATRIARLSAPERQA
jgi:tetratricopeptide (TPR) repeat protein